MDQWAKTKATSDPDWKLKQPLVAEQLELEIRRLGPTGFPQTGADSIALVEKSLLAVENRMKSFAPKPQQIRPITGQAASSRSTPAPKDAVEAARFALRAMNG